MKILNNKKGKKAFKLKLKSKIGKRDAAKIKVNAKQIKKLDLKKSEFFSKIKVNKKLNKKNKKKQGSDPKNVDNPETKANVAGTTNIQCKKNETILTDLKPKVVKTKIKQNWVVEDLETNGKSNEMLMEKLIERDSSSDSDSDSYIQKYFEKSWKEDNISGLKKKNTEQEEVCTKIVNYKPETDSESTDEDFSVDEIDFENVFDDDDDSVFMDEDLCEEDGYFVDEDELNSLSTDSYTTSDMDDEDEETDDSAEYDMMDYNSSDDEDYVCEDLIVKKGEANIYDASEVDVSFDSTSDAQIVELPENFKKQTDSDNESCPELVPIEQDYMPTFHELPKRQQSEPTLMEHIRTEAEKVTRKFKVVNKSVFYNSIVTSAVLLHLQEKISFNGHFSATLIAGRAESFGYEFQLDRNVQMFSPNTQSLLYLTPIQSSHTSGKLQFNEEISKLFFKRDLNRIRESFNVKTDAVLLLKRIQSSRLMLMNQMTKRYVFPNISPLSRSQPLFNTEIQLGTHFYNENIVNPERSVLNSTEEWDKIKIRQDSRCMVAGINHTGKSTIVRYLINQNVVKCERILLIDFDIGQSEIGLPQTVSASIVSVPLFGPGCFHGIVPEKSYLFGDNQPCYDPIKYVRVCYNLMQWVRSRDEYSKIPWIINTMGYDKGLAVEIIQILIRMSQINQLIQLVSCRKHEEFRDGIFELGEQPNFTILRDEFEMMDKTTIPNYELIQINTNSKDFRKKIAVLPSIITKMKFNSFLGDILARNGAMTFNEIRPKVTSLDNLKIITTYCKFATEFLGNHKINYDEILNSTLVYLCGSDMDENAIEVYGLGIVRLVDNEKNEIYLLSGVSDTVLENVKVLANVKVNLELELFKNQHLVIDGELPYLAEIEDFIGSRQVIQQIYRPDSVK